MDDLCQFSLSVAWGPSFKNKAPRDKCPFRSPLSSILSANPSGSRLNPVFDHRLQYHLDKKPISNKNCLTERRTRSQSSLRCRNHGDTV